MINRSPICGADRWFISRVKRGPVRWVARTDNAPKSTCDFNSSMGRVSCAWMYQLVLLARAPHGDRDFSSVQAKRPGATPSIKKKRSNTRP